MTEEGAPTQLSTGTGSQPLLCLKITVMEPWPCPLLLALEALLRPLSDPGAPPHVPGLSPVNSMSEFLPKGFGLAELVMSRMHTHTHTHAHAQHTCCLHTQKHYPPHTSHMQTTCHTYTPHTHTHHTHTHKHVFYKPRTHPALAHIHMHTLSFQTGLSLSHITPLQPALYTTA